MSVTSNRLQPLIKRVASTDSSILLSGESGTGKDFTAKLIHQHSSRQKGPFVPVDCGTLREELFESELFGHQRGAFTGAIKSRLGKIPSASGGTLFLDGIDHLSLPNQTRLLRALQEKEVHPLGAEHSKPIDFRLITSTSESFDAKLKEGQFRNDLYYRIKVIELKLPPLRDRKNEVESLATLLLKEISNRFGKKVRRFERQTLETLKNYSWPGNIRELQAVLECAVASTQGEILRVHDLPVFVRSRTSQPREEPKEPPRSKPKTNLEADLKPFQEQVEIFQRQLITQTLTQFNWNYVMASEQLKLSRHQLKYLCSKLGIRRPRV